MRIYVSFLDFSMTCKPPVRPYLFQVTAIFGVEGSPLQFVHKIGLTAYIALEKSDAAAYLVGQMRIAAADALESSPVAHHLAKSRILGYVPTISDL